MNVYKLVGRNLEVTEGIRSHVEERLDKLERFFSGIVDAKVVLTVRASNVAARRNKVEMQLNVPHGIIRAEEANADMYQAIDAAVDVLERQLKKFRSKFIERSHSFNGHGANQNGRSTVLEIPETEEVEEFDPEIVRTKNFEIRPMSPEDAAAQMEALHHDFFVFANAKSGSMNVIYRRHDGNYGLIEPR